MCRVLADMYSALAPMVGQVRVGSTIPTCRILPWHLHLPERFGKRTLPGQLLVCLSLVEVPSTSTHTAI
jgi:hypothetical protein